MAKPLLLASSSPQRRALLARLGVAFEAVDPHEEELAEGEPTMLARENALRKARAGARLREGWTVLGADTVVALGGRTFDKPRTRGEAEQMLRALSGQAHTVYGGLAVVEGTAERTTVVKTKVVMRELTEPLLRWYLDRGEWRSRAGGYAIQGAGAALVKQVVGDYENVVGLSVNALLALVPDLLWRGFVHR